MDTHNRVSRFHHFKFNMDGLSASYSIHLDEDISNFKNIQKSKFTLNLILAMTAAAMGSFANGTVISYTSPATYYMKKDNVIHLTTEQLSWFSSLATVGALIGANVAGWGIEHLGRKYSIIISNMIVFIGWLMIAYSNEVSVLYLGRIVTGFGMSCNTMIIPVYLVEISPLTIRGIVYTAAPLFTAGGILFTYSVGMYVGWHWLAGIALFIPTISIVAMIWMPESPSWLMKRGQEDEIAESLEWLRQSKDTVDEECLILSRHVANQKEITWSKLTGFWSKSIQKPLGICLILMILQQFSGYNAIIFYSTNIFSHVAPNRNPQVSTVLIGLAKVIPLFFTCFIIDMVGRRKLLLLSTAVTFLSNLTVGIYNYLETNSSDKNYFSTNYGFVPLIGLIVFIITFSMGLGPIPWLIMSEILPLRARGIASGIATCVNWTCAFIVTKEFDDLNYALKFYGTFWLFSFFCLLALVIVWFFIPETKGRSHTEIDTFFKEKNKCFNFC